MRADCTIDRKAIPCPNASLLAGGKGRACPGNCILYRERYADGSWSTRIARVLGRVSAPAGEGPKVKGFALVMALSNDATFAYERWIDPANILQVFESPARFAAFFFAPKLPYNAETMRKLMAYGTVCESYIDDVAERAKQIA